MNFSLPDCPPPVRDGRGYVYALAFSNDSVAVGKTVYPASSIAVHIYNAARVEADLTDWWVSTAHDGHPLTEQAVTAIAAGLSSGAAGDGFRGVDFRELVSLCEQLHVDTPTVEVFDTDATVAVLARPAGRSEDTALFAKPQPAEPSGSVAEFAALVTGARKGRRLSQEALEELTGVSRSTLSRWERGLADRPTPKNVRALCAVLDIPVPIALVALGYLSKNEAIGVLAA